MRRKNADKHPALAGRLAPYHPSEATEVQLQVQGAVRALLKPAMYRLKELINGDNTAVALGAIKHLHAIAGLTRPNGYRMEVQYMIGKVNMFGKHNGHDH